MNCKMYGKASGTSAASSAASSAARLKRTAIPAFLLFCACLISCGNVFQLSDLEGRATTHSSPVFAPPETTEAPNPPPEEPASLPAEEPESPTDVAEAPVVTGISILTLPARTVYGLGETLDVAGLAINVTYSDSTTSTITPATANLSITEAPEAAGTGVAVSVSVTYSGHTVTGAFSIDVFPVVTSMSGTPPVYIGYANFEAAFDDAPLEGGPVITIYESQDIPARDGSGFQVNGGRTITVRGYGDTAAEAKQLTHYVDEPMFAITNANSHLILDGAITLDGSTFSGVTNPLVSLNGQVFLTMNGYAAISGNTNTNDGGGVYMSGNGGTLTMNDYAEISDNTTNGNKGGGVCTHTGGGFTLIMNGNAKISENTTEGTGVGGGGVYMNGPNCTLIMNDNAAISGNINEGTSGGGVNMNGDNCTLTMNGNAKISDNTTTSSINSSSKSGGVYMYGPNCTLTMNDNAEISGNTVNVLLANQIGRGGGVYLSFPSGEEPLSLIMNGNAKINDNHVVSGNSAYGGGIYMEGAGNTITLSEDAEISGNTTNAASSFCQGGGLYISNGIVTMTGGTITGNVSSGSNARGGGVYLTTNARLTIDSPAGRDNITGNTAASGGQNVMHNFDCIVNGTGDGVSPNAGW